MGKDLKFPPGFLWGASTSAFQVEGNVTKSDWWEWEQKVQPLNFRSGLSCDHYNRFNDDFELAKNLGHNAHRLSLEWSRIEPTDGVFDNAEILHYQEVLKALKKRGMKVMLTLHHFSNPLWFAQKGGWASCKAPYYFERFVKRIVPEFKDNVDLWVTINEPLVLAQMGYIEGKWPPHKKNILTTLKVLANLACAHKKAYRAIHSLDSQAKVGLAHNMTSFDVLHHHCLRELVSEYLADIITNHSIYLLTGKTHDFIGLNYYMNQYIGLKQKSFLPHLVDISSTKREISDMGWEVNPEGMFDILTDIADYHLPIYITENGVATHNDERRVRFLINYLLQIYHSLKTGADVKGYFHWSLLDNLEWHHGFDPKFGLIDIDFKTLKRTPKPSSLVYQEIIKNNGIPHELLKLLGHGVHIDEVINLPK